MQLESGTQAPRRLERGFQMLKLFTLAHAVLVQRLAGPEERESGQTMAEYAVVLAVITLVVIGAMQLLGGNISTAVSRVAGYVK